MALLGFEPKIVQPKIAGPKHGCAGWKMADADRPPCLLGCPREGEHTPGNGRMMAAFVTPDRAMEDRCHGLASGCPDAGAPGLSAPYHPSFYDASIREPNGNRFER